MGLVTGIILNLMFSDDTVKGDYNANPNLKYPDKTTYVNPYIKK